MKRPKKLLPPALTAVMFVAAMAMLLFGSVESTRAALTYYSETYASRVQMYNIGVSLKENGERVSWRDYNSAGNGTWNEHTGVLLSHMLEEGESLKLGKTYEEVLNVVNSGTINQYVRVTIYKYWMDAEGKKLQELSPALIDLNLVNLGSDWILDEEATTPERTVLYYKKLLYAEGKGVSETSPFADTLTIDGMVASKVSQEKVTEGGYTTITTSYDYDGVQFMLEAKVDAVQEHNAEDAILSAWGRSVTVSNHMLSLD